MFSVTNVLWLRVMARVRDSADRGAVQAAVDRHAAISPPTEGKTFTVEEISAVTLVGGARTGIDAARLRDAAADARGSRGARLSARMREHRRADAGPRRRATPRILGPARARRGRAHPGAARPGREPRAGNGRGRPRRPAGPLGITGDGRDPGGVRYRRPSTSSLRSC